MPLGVAVAVTPALDCDDALDDELDDALAFDDTLGAKMIDSDSRWARAKIDAPASRRITADRSASAQMGAERDGGRSRLPESLGT